MQYADFALWRRAWLDRGALAAGLQYWTQQLAGSPERLALPTDRPRPAVQTFAAALHQQIVPAAALAALKARSQAQHATLYMTLLAALGVLLGHYSGQEDLRRAEVGSVTSTIQYHSRGFVRDGVVRFLTTDHLGSVRELTDVSGVVGLDQKG